VTTGGSGASAALTFAVSRASAGATLALAGINTALSAAGTTRSRFTTAPTGHDRHQRQHPGLRHGGRTASAFDFASVSGSNLIPFAGYTAAASTVPPPSADVVKVTANDTLTANRQVAAVLLSGDNLTVSGAFTLTLGAGPC